MNVEYTELYTLFEILRMLIVLNYVILGKNVYVECSEMSTVFLKCVHWIYKIVYIFWKKKIVYIKVQNCALYLKKLIKKCVS